MKKDKIALSSLKVRSFKTIRSIKGGGNSSWCPTLDIQCAISDSGC
ncbi:MAG: hypothetical protein WBB45_10195 [Cyclobacteriaceae bacterium]